MKVLVCGGRNYSNPDAVYSALDRLHSRRGISCIIEGGALGADCFAAEWADVRGVSHRQFNANWAKHGKAAGPRRNQRMLKDGQPDLVVAFPGGRGTADMVRRAESAGVEVLKVEE